MNSILLSPVKKGTYTVLVEIEVNNPAALYDAAVAAARAEEYPDPVDLLGTRERPDIGACLQYVLDPGTSPAGTEILNSHVQLHQLQ